MTLNPAVAGDAADVRTLAVGGIANLEDVTAAVLRVRQSSGDDTEIPCDITDLATDGTVSVPLGDWLATIDGGRPAWNIELVLTFPAGPLTVPPDRPDTISVRASIDTD